MSESSPLSHSTTVSLTEIEKLRTQVSEIATALNNQQEILRMRGMNLPPGALRNLEHIDRDLSKLEKRLGSEETELAQLRALAMTAAMISSTLNLDEVLTRAMEEVIKLTGSERGYIMLKDPATGVLECRVARDTDGSARSNGASQFQGSSTVLNEVIATGEALLTDNAFNDPRMQDNASIAQMVLRSVLCVPLNYKGEVIGAVYVDNRLKSGVFTEREKSILVAFANQGAVAIENARLFARVQFNLEEITALKEVMSNVFDSIGSGVITADAQDVVQTFNNAAADILRQQPEQAIGQLLRDVMPALGESFSTYLRAVLDDNQSRAMETEVEMAERGRMILNLKLSPLKDSEQNTQGVTMVMDDLTEQHEREEKINLLRRYLPKNFLQNAEQIAGLTLQGDRREMTCIFVDVRPFSTFPANLRSSDVMALLNEYLAVATDCIDSQNGVIDKYMGTEVMALFNTPLNEMQTDHAVKALEAALEMREAFVQLYRKQKINPTPHFYRLGIHTGWATTGNVGSVNRRDFTALGDTINLAHRILENAEPGQMILSDSTCDSLKAALGKLPKNVQFHEREPIKAKGRQQATSVFEVFRA